MIESLLFVIFIVIMLFLYAWPISLPLLIYCIIKKRQNKKEFKNTVIHKNGYINNGNYYLNRIQDAYIDIDNYKLKDFDSNDLEALKLYFGSLFLEFEKAYNNIDYKTLYNLCTHSLYSLYSSDLNVKSKLCQKKTIDNVEIEKMVIYNSVKDEKEHKVYVMIRINSINYTQNAYGTVIAGNAYSKTSEEFIVTFIKMANIKDESVRCPNCGAMINSTKCEYCNTEFKQYDFKICSINKLV